MKRRILVIALVLYFVTGFGTWNHYSDKEKEAGNNAYKSAFKAQNTRNKECEKFEWPNCGIPVAHPDGPKYHTLTIPILPGIAIVSSGYSAGPLWGQSSTKIVLWYGLGVRELIPLFGMIS